MKKQLSILVICLAICTMPYNVKANENNSSIVAIDIPSGRILYEKNANEKKLIASTTKIMTAILTIENGDLNQKIIVSEEVLKMYGTNIYLSVGEEMSIKDLLYGLILRSGNDAAVVLAKNIGGTEEKFVDMMNIKAKELGMNSTTFQNPHGLDDNTKNISTAYDMALLSQYAYENQTYREISMTKKYKTSTHDKSYLWINRNKLLSIYSNCTGGKNGYTPLAGKSLVSTAEKNDMQITMASLNDPNIYENQQSLYEKLFKKYKNYTIIDKSNFSISKSLYKGKTYIKNSFIYPLSATELPNVKTLLKINKTVATDNKIGTITIKLKNDIIGKVDIYAESEKKEAKNFFSKIKSQLLEILKKLKLGLQNNLNPGPLVPIPLEIYNLDSSKS